MPHFQLVTIDGEALGPMHLGPPDWPIGSVIYRGAETNLRVVGNLPADDTEHQFTVLIVEPVE